jgi:hypothetical protein
MNIAFQVFRTKRFSVLVLAALAAGGFLIWSATPAAADPPYVPQAPFPAGLFNETVQAPKTVPGKEYSTHTPGVYGTGDEDHFHALDPEQVLNWDGVGGTYDGVDFSGSRFMSDPPDTLPREVDALANITDAFFHEVQTELSHLVFSVQDDGHIYYEKRTSGAGGVWATPATIDAHHPPEDIDGLELWGPEPPLLTDPPYTPTPGDANRYSLESPAPLGIPDPLGISVWDVSAGGPAVPLWLAGEIGAIVSMAAHLPAPISPQQINLDGLMTHTHSIPDPTGGPGFITVDEILFSIDPVGPPGGAPLFDGGEIFTATRHGGVGGPITAAGFLFHGGHLWDTAFPVATTFGVASENVDALESVIGGIPEPASLTLSMLALAGLISLVRRR